MQTASSQPKELGKGDVWETEEQILKRGRGGL